MRIFFYPSSRCRKCIDLEQKQIKIKKLNCEHILYSEMYTCTVSSRAKTMAEKIASLMATLGKE